MDPIMVCGGPMDCVIIGGGIDVIGGPIDGGIDVIGGGIDCGGNDVKDCVGGLICWEPSEPYTGCGGADIICGCAMYEFCTSD